jgi:hypothetical protein
VLRRRAFGDWNDSHGKSSGRVARPADPVSIREGAMTHDDPIGSGPKSATLEVSNDSVRHIDLHEPSGMALLAGRQAARPVLQRLQMLHEVGFGRRYEV